MLNRMRMTISLKSHHGFAWCYFHSTRMKKNSGWTLFSVLYGWTTGHASTISALSNGRNQSTCAIFIQFSELFLVHYSESPILFSGSSGN